MRLIISFSICLFSFCGVGQSSNTFFVKKRSDGEIKAVYTVGDKLVLESKNELNETVKIKGEISAIENGQITVNNQVIPISKIVQIKRHITERKILGGALAATGIGIGIAARNIKDKGGMFDFYEFRRGFWTFVGGAITVSSTIYLIVLPKKFRTKKFEFRTFISS